MGPRASAGMNVNAPTIRILATNSPTNKELQNTLKECGIDYLLAGRIQMEPLGNNKYVKTFNWLGKHNHLEQTFITRNCFFEPVSDYYSGKNWVNDCLNEIDIAFRWHKPAIISTHRVNYIGSINPSNRKKGLLALEMLLTNIINRWPDVEFLTSVEVGDLISESNKKN